MKAYVIANGRYIFDFDKDDYSNHITSNCLLPTKHIAELIQSNLLDGDGEVKEIEFIAVEDRLSAYHEGYKQGQFDVMMSRNNE